MPPRRTAKAPSRDNIIATRELDVAGSRRKAVVTLWQPTQAGEQKWVCEYRVPGMRKPRRSRGCDAFQALIHALEAIRIALNQSPGRYNWFEDDSGEHGFPLIVPYGFCGAGLQARLERIIDREITDFLRTEMRASEARAARKAARAADGA